jgi:hypothetical protein
MHRLCGSCVQLLINLHVCPRRGPPSHDRHAQTAQGRDFLLREPPRSLHISPERGDRAADPRRLAARNRPVVVDSLPNQGNRRARCGGNIAAHGRTEHLPRRCAIANQRRLVHSCAGSAANRFDGLRMR